MIPPSPSDINSIEEHDFEQLVQDGILAVKNGNRPLAKRLLNQAALMNASDVRIWIWLSGTTDDMQERKEYLEHAVALDPSNATAKRGLLLVTNKLDQARLVPESAPPTPTPTPAPRTEEATSKTYICPNCGATISYDIHETVLVCQFCGFTRKIDEQVALESKDQPLDAVLPTTLAHRWVESQARVSCEQCGSVIILPAGQTADTCPYCGANRFVSSASLVEMVDPQVIIPFKIDPENAGNQIKTWLSKGILSPDNAAAQQVGIQLRPAYYPFWLFEGTLEVPWFCDVNVGSGRLAHWEAHSGSQFELFKDIIIPGVRKMPLAEVAGIEPYEQGEMVEFSPDYLAGWMALTYDQPLADASLLAREKVFKRIQPTLASQVEVGHSKRNFSTGVGKWSGLTYKLALLPVLIGNYTFHGKLFPILVNGQTGKVSGKKPVDVIKAVMMGIIGIILLLVIIVLLLVLVRAISG